MSMMKLVSCMRLSQHTAANWILQLVYALHVAMKIKIFYLVWQQHAGSILFHVHGILYFIFSCSMCSPAPNNEGCISLLLPQALGTWHRNFSGNGQGLGTWRVGFVPHAPPENNLGSYFTAPAPREPCIEFCSSGGQGLEASAEV